MRQEPVLWPASAKTIADYGPAPKFLATFALANTRAYTQTPEARCRCVVGTAPSLNVVANAYGDSVADLWMFDFLSALYTACGQKPKADQITAIADALREEYGHLKVTDFMLFSVKLRAGAFGSFYGSADIHRVGVALRDYCQWRTEAIAKWQKADEHRRAEILRRDIYQNGISLADYLQGKDEMTEGGKTFLRQFMAQTPDDFAAIDRLKTKTDLGNETPPQP